MLSGGGERGVDNFTRINSMAYVYLLLPGSEFSCVFSWYAHTLDGAILARNNAFADSKQHCLVACKY